MHAVSVSGLKHNPADALRQARSSPVVVLNRDHPDAVLIGLEQGGVLQAPGVRAALATALFRDGELCCLGFEAAPLQIGADPLLLAPWQELGLQISNGIQLIAEQEPLGLAAQ